jgi:threonine synthase
MTAGSRFSFLEDLECSRCARRYDADVLSSLCECGSPLLARYDLDGLARSVEPSDLDGRAPSLWRYHELLPVRQREHVVSLGEGLTPIVPLPRLGRRLGLERLSLKDEGRLPTGTFKARGAAVGVARAKELGVSAIAMPTNGNAGAAWATYAARAGLRSLVVMPADAPAVTRAECAVAGAELYLVDGLIGDATRIVAEAVQRRSCFDVSTFKEPYRLEGKKTMGIELAEQLGWRVPDVVVYPTGGGVGLIGIHKALGELRELGWIGPRLPRLVAVQAAGCAPIVRAFEQGKTESEPWPDPHTVAFGITVPKPLADFLILGALYATDGCAIAVDDEAIMEAERTCASSEGLFLCPEGAATVAAVERLVKMGWLQRDEEVVLLNTGTGLKYPESVRAQPPTLPRDGVLS